MEEHPPLYVHLDLKGAPPTLPWLLALLPRLRAWGAAGILIEYEDAFPYEGALACLRAPTAYSRAEVRALVRACDSLGLEVIPLVQTFGHLEFVLKHRRFAHLRETADEVNCLAAGLAEARRLAVELVRQVAALHEGSRYFHIGCDEVRCPAAAARSAAPRTDTLSRAAYPQCALMFRAVPRCAAHSGRVTAGVRVRAPPGDGRGSAAARAHLLPRACPGRRPGGACLFCAGSAFPPPSGQRLRDLSIL